MFDYQYSLVLPCFCHAKKLYEKNIKPKAIKVNNKDNTITGCHIEKLYYIDELAREHVKSINHCQNCKP